jgi:hypothetical protein
MFSSTQTLTLQSLSISSHHHILLVLKSAYAEAGAETNPYFLKIKYGKKTK